MRLEAACIHLVGGHHKLRLPVCGLQSRTFCPIGHQLYVLCALAIVTLNYLSVGLSQRISFTNLLIFCPLHSTLCNLEVPYEAHSKRPRFRAGNTHWIQTSIFRHCGILDKKTLRSVLNALSLAKLDLSNWITWLRRHWRGEDRAPN